MTLRIENGLKTSQKLDLLLVIFTRKPIRLILDDMSVQELVEAHSFLWDKLVELHYKTQKNEFDRNDVTRFMVPSAIYQRKQRCNLRLDYCKGVECVWSNPICASNKVKKNIEIMAKVMVSYLDSKTEKKYNLLSTENKIPFEFFRTDRTQL